MGTDSETIQRQELDAASSVETISPEDPQVASESRIDADAAVRRLAPRIAELAAGVRGARVLRVWDVRRLAWTGVGVGSLVAGAAVITIAVGSALAPPTVPDAAAVDVWERAAAMADGAEDSALAAGQYLRIDTITEYLQFWNAEWAVDDEDTSPFNATRENADAAVLVRENRALYIPADRATDWVYDWGHAVVVESFGPHGDEAAEERSSWPATRGADHRRFETLPAGEFLAEGTDEPPTPYLADRYRPYYDDMSRDPQQLLEWLRAQSGATGTEADRRVVATLADPSAINLMPRDLRSAFFRAIALIPGFDVLTDDGVTATLRYVVPWHRTTTIVIDTARGLITSIAESSGTGGPAGDTRDSVTTVDISVVDEPPQK